MSSFLLDTHVWLWLNNQPGRLPADLLNTLTLHATERILSAASAWEIAIKFELGKLQLPEPPRTYVPRRLRATATQSVPIGLSQVLSAAALPRHHADPFDRLILAQAQELGIPLVTADAQLEPYGTELILVP